MKRSRPRARLLFERGSRAWPRVVLSLVLVLVLDLGHVAPNAADETPYWLKYGKSIRTCPGSSDVTPFKVEGASWGILVSGIVLCRDLGSTYSYAIQFLNVAIDPADKRLIKRDVVDFDWCGLALYRPTADGTDIDWLYDQSSPVKGELRKDATGRIVFGNITFTVPKGAADTATNMLFYLTFDGPLVAINAV